MARRLRLSRQRRRKSEVQIGEIRRAMRRFRPALAGQRLRIAGAVVLALAGTMLALLKPWPISWVIDHLVAAPDPTVISLRPIVLFAMVAFLVPVALGFAAERLEILVAMISRKATVRIRGELFGHMNRLELVEHQRLHSGDLIVRLMGDVNMIRDLLVPSWLNLLSRGSLLIGAAAVFAFIDWRLFLVALIPLPLLWIHVDRTSAAVKSAAGKQRRKEGAIASQAAESLRQVELVKAFAAEERTTDQFVRTARGAERASMAATRHAARMARTTELLTGFGVALVLVAGAVRVRSGVLTPGELVLVISYTRLMYQPVRKLTAEGARLAKAVACANRVIDVLDRPVERNDEGRRVRALRGQVEICGLGHVYSDGRRSLGGLDATVPAGALVAVTGENGTGKSTLLSLLLRLHAPSEGTILVDGTNITHLRIGEYRDQIAYVPQELSLFGGTIRDNILFGRPDATDDEIRAAADLALFTPVLDRLPLGLDTELDEAGASLSGGQARRLMLARAAIRDASILLLDEPLAGLDPDARTLVARAISNIADGRTTFVVHHGDLDELGPDMELRLERLELNRPTLRAVASWAAPAYGS